jgi:hypothetical protein
MRTTSFCILLALLASCNSQPKETKEQANDQQTTEKQDLKVNCYQYASLDDTVTLTLIHPAENVTGGTLVYKFKEKDGNRGTIQGSMKGDLLLANYTFTSEGTLSTRQVAFKLSGNAFYEGYGDIVVENDTVKYKNVDSLDFSSSFKLQEIPCN